ncbi:AIPR family protein [Bradyrhizobium japonicum]|uniref:AIPR family protein n=1 Tax=Bradyrhizobium japonicum TaxID=375 RepID=UPI001BAE326A|nr:AIPR family protein [Bradyrhizobium japonicum]MBR0911500.1 AIPR family protein [Bradyrhizobium japonicum]
MTENRDILAFAATLAAEVADRALGDIEAGEFSENAFVQVVSEHLAEIGMLEDPVVCYHTGNIGSGVIRLNGFAAGDDAERIDLLVAIHDSSGQPRSVPSTEISRVAGQAARALQAASRNIHEELEKASDQYAMMHRISELLSGGVQEARVFVLTDGLTAVRSLPPSKIGKVDVTFEVYDLRRLMRTMATGQSREMIDIDLEAMGLDPIPCVAMPAADGEFESYLAIFPGEALYRIYDEYGPRLLEYNVRAFLQASGKVNRGIRDTLRDEPQHFMAYNNGISVTVDEINTGQIDGRPVITSFKGLQIVNGGQTTASIHRARKRDRFDLSRVHIPAKVTRLPPDSVERMVPQISRFANTQNVIQEADFSSNEPFHIAMERLSKSTWCPGEQSRWFYERSRGQYQTAMNIEGTTPARLRAFRERTPPAQRFSKTDLARFLNSWARLPHVVSAGAQKNFIAFMRNLRETRGSRWEPDQVYYRDAIAQAILYQAAGRVVRAEHFPAYRTNITTYLVALISHRTAGRLQLDEIWRQQKISSELETILRAWSHPVDRDIQSSASGRNVTEWCKKAECWHAIRRLDLPLPVVPPEWGPSGIDDGDAEQPDPHEPTRSSDEHAGAVRCMSLSAQEWFSLHLWGRKTGHLADWQVGIALTLSGYAGDDWRRSPSAKQARQGVRILEIAQAEGYSIGQAPLSDEATASNG